MTEIILLNYSHNTVRSQYDHVINAIVYHVKWVPVTTNMATFSGCNWKRRSPDMQGNREYTGRGVARKADKGWSSKLYIG
jgi:hypothetical protein